MSEEEKRIKLLLSIKERGCVAYHTLDNSTVIERYWLDGKEVSIEEINKELDDLGYYE